MIITKFYQRKIKEKLTKAQKKNYQFNLSLKLK